MSILPGFPLNIEAFYSFATSQGYLHWINLGISIILSTIIGGIVLIILAKVLSRWTGNISSFTHAFLVVLIINVINWFGILGILLGFIAGIPFMGLIIPALVWIGLLKVFFGELNFKGAVILGIIMYFLSFLLIPMLVAVAGSFIILG